MKNHKKITWEYWNEKEKEFLDSENKDKNKENNDFLQSEKNDLIPTIPFNENPLMLGPFGAVEKKSIFKPTDRWECWIANTNFKITEDFYNFLNEKVDGISAFKILDPYSFAIGVAKLFEFKDVAIQIKDFLEETNGTITPDEPDGTFTE
jgi:hypothetical protein